MHLTSLKIVVLKVALAGAAFLLPAAAQAGYLFTDITSPSDPTFTQLLGINNAGTIAGYFGSGTAGYPKQTLSTVIRAAQSANCN
ncbi:MAG: hypothetical protein ACR2I2_09575 [Bryobacteraceae bacterium]